MNGGSQTEKNKSLDDVTDPAAEAPEGLSRALADVTVAGDHCDLDYYICGNHGKLDIYNILSSSSWQPSQPGIL